MPPKPKLHGKIKTESSFSKPTTSSGSNLDIQAQEQFEVELYWCIHKLQNALSSNKLNPKQMEETTKNLKILSSKNASFIQKRQLMRTVFGDYRKKMADEEKKYNKVNQQISVKSVVPSTKSVFVKKSAFTQSNPNFQFNFNVSNPTDTEANVDNVLSKLNITNETSHYHYQPSENTFRFNFDTK